MNENALNVFTTRENTAVGDLIIPTEIHPESLMQTYRTKVGKVVEFGTGLPFVKFDIMHGGETHFYVREWVHQTPKPGDKVRVIAALDGASEEFKRLAAGRTGKVVALESGLGAPYRCVVDFDEPFRLGDGDEWARSAVKMVAVIEEAPSNPVGQVEVAVEPETVESLRQQIRDLRSRYEGLQDALAEEAEERDWCGEFEEFCERNGIESRRQRERDYEFEIDLHYSKTIDEVVDAIEGTRCPSDNETVSFTYRIQVTITTAAPGDVDVAEHIIDAGYSNWEDYTVVEYQQV